MARSSRGVSEEKVADEDADETPKDAATNEGFGDGTGVGIREVALYCSDEAAARALAEQIAAVTNAARNRS